MKCGFTYKNRHSSEFGIVAKTMSRPVLPEMKSYTMEAPLADSVYDFSEANEYGRAFYNDRFFEVQLQISADNLTELEEKVSKIAVWLSGKGELSFDDLPNVKWSAAVISELGFMPELYGKKAVMTVSFRVKPFSRCVFDLKNGPVLDSDLKLDENLPIELSGIFSKVIGTDGDTFREFSKTIRFVNMGNTYVRPAILINGSIKSASLTCVGKTLKIEVQSEDGYVLDFNTQTVTDVNGGSIMPYVSGDFFEIPPEGCDIQMTLKIKSAVEVEFSYIPEFIYAFDVDDVDWGDGNA